jgi:hypothetical protein
MKARSPIRSSCFLLLLLAPLLSGCRNCELLEIALRSREQDIQVLREEVSQLEYHNEALQREVHGLRQSDAYKVTPELATQTYTVKRIVLGTGTGGIDDDRKEGDEALQVVIQPMDNANDIIKTPGSADISAMEVTPEGLKLPLSAWKISADQMRQNWKQGVFSTGYVLKLPWQQTPHFENIRVIVRFETSDGRPFEADKDIKIRLNPQQKRPLPVIPGPGQAVPPVIEESLPAPRPWPAPEQANPGPVLQRTSHWQSPSLEGSMRLLPPVSIRPAPQEYLY